ncbi:MAG: serine hydrolase domain-containing protein, partial [Woeseiaceae bacterium]
MKVRYFAATVVVLALLGSHANGQEEWPTNGWTATTPLDVGLDARVLAEIDADIGEGKYGYVDSMLVIRHGKLAYERYYGHDYAEIYGEEAATRGPLVVGHLTGSYNYFNEW